MTAAPEKTYIVDLTEAQIDRAVAALEEAPNLIAHARSICDTLYAMVSQDQVILDEMTGFLDMAARGFEAAERKHDGAFVSLADRLRAVQVAINGMRKLEAQTIAHRAASSGGGQNEH